MIEITINWYEGKEARKEKVISGLKKYLSYYLSSSWQSFTKTQIFLFNIRLKMLKFKFSEN